MEKKTGNDNTTKVVPAAAGYEVHLSDSAAVSYERYANQARNAVLRGEPTNAHCTALRQIDEALEKIIPSDPFNKKYALVGDLKTIYRLHKGRLRICWVGSSRQRRIYVIFISETLRKAGDINDPYQVLSRKVAAGEFDQLFAILGMKLRSRSITDRIQ